MNKFYQYKTNGYLKDVDMVTKTVTGYFAAFGNKDHDNDVFIPGAFSKSIKERGPAGTNQIFHLLGHDISRPLGKPMILREDKIGLYFETPIPDTSYGIDTLKLYEGKVYNEHSVGFITIINEQNKETDTNELKEVKLWEGSTVLWGSNDQTPFIGFKSEDLKKEIENRVNTLMKAIKISGLSDDLYALFEIELKQLKSLIEPKSTPEPNYTQEFAKFFTN